MYGGVCLGLVPCFFLSPSELTKYYNSVLNKVSLLSCLCWGLVLINHSRAIYFLFHAVLKLIRWWMRESLIFLCNDAIEIPVFENYTPEYCCNTIQVWNKEYFDDLFRILVVTWQPTEDICWDHWMQSSVYLWGNPHTLNSKKL